MAGPTTSGLAALVAGEDWHYVDVGSEPALENGWIIDGSYPPLAFRIREAGIVEMQGVVGVGTPGSTIFTLPEGYRPSTNFTFFGTVGSIAGSFSAGLVLIDQDGHVYGDRSPAQHDSIFIKGEFYLSPPA